MTNLAPKELSAERLAEWYIAQGDWSKEYSFDWFQALPMVKTGQQIYEAHIAHLEQRRTETNLDNMRLRDSLAKSQQALAAEQDARKAAEQEAEVTNKLLKIANETLQHYKTDRDRLREALLELRNIKERYGEIPEWAEVWHVVDAVLEPAK